MSQQPIGENTLYFGDNLDILRKYIPNESVDLIYLDPPFSSNRNFSVIFKDERGIESEAQIHAFEDAWHWSSAAALTYHELATQSSPKIASMIAALHEFVGENQMMAYLVMMTVRLIELHRVLKPTGSLYLHCDSTAVHYLKVLLDTIFDARNFRNEIIWKRQSAHSDAKHQFPDVVDIILFYGKSKSCQFTPQYGEYASSYIENFYRFNDHDGRGPYSLDNMASPNPRPNMMYNWKGFPCPTKGWRYQRETMQRLDDEGRIWYPTLPDGSLDPSRRPRLKRYLEEQEGSIVTNVWTDIQPLHDVSGERMGYPTQKPLALLERIIAASSKPGDIVLDPFCGCGTTVAAAEHLKRRWIGVDITYLGILLQKNRLKDMFGDIPYCVVGEPTDKRSAYGLAKDNPYQFQWWAIDLVNGRPYGGQAGSRNGKKGSDRGIDGIINFRDDTTGRYSRALVQVKSGHVKSGDIRDLRGTIDRESAALGVFITLNDPSDEMTREALSAGYYHSPALGRDYPRIQIYTVDQLLHGATVQMPMEDGTLRQVARLQVQPTQKEFGLA